MVFSRKLDFFSVAEKMFFSSIYSHISSIKDIFVLKQIITLVKDIFHVKISKAPKHTCFKQCSRAGAGGAKIILRPGAGAEIIFIINIFCCQFGGCQVEEKLISTSISMVLLLQNSFKWQYYMAVAGAGAGAEIMDKGGDGAGA